MAPMKTRVKSGPAGGGLSFFLLTGCSDRGPADGTGERIDETAPEDPQDRMEEIPDNQPGRSA